ncbi:hypothetical protein C483_15961 [Natrialba hulunbeirensis JCM 10989]|uniref:Uncharacterized protein n=1 Tax=Natrialba hulunbeirensis JCM 10989 TaxID=1227493 RepID=L9ZSR0_9EURY|nr:hypothetical protein [Natrialba hulunbeirensis]ELY88223.1 hypothetical protein C483_15961 [Natrialba hulunbeirensis JCM 10989]
MATHTESTTDKGVGLALALSAVAVLGALLMVTDIEAAWGFAGAVLFSSLAVVAIHLYWE